MSEIPNSSAEAPRLIAQPGHNCWRREQAGRAAFIIDSADYFPALAESLLAARETILIAGWDFDTRLRLRRDEDFPRLGRLLSDLVSRRRELRVYILVWDFPILFAMDRELFPLFNFHPRTLGRIKVHFDGLHPISASHHQKIVVVDDQVAYVGGVDLTGRRWDTNDHLPHDPRRVEVEGEPYRSYHDVEAAVSGDAAQALGELFRERWNRSVGEPVFPPQPRPSGDPWPQSLEPDLREVPVAIARTDPYGAGGPIREVEELYLDSIAAARSRLYIEAQYLSSVRVVDALAVRLREADGPEVLIVGPRRNPGWIEHQIMGALRVNAIRRLQGSDRHDRLRIFYPRVGEIADDAVFIHSKLMMIDDECLRIGSSNLSNRSMGMDTECDLFFEAAGDARVSEAIVRLRNRLLAEHLGAAETEVAEAIAQEGSLVRAADRLRGREHTLEPVHETMPEWMNVMVSDSLFLDPDEPASVEALVENLIPEELKGPARWRGIITFLSLSLIAMLGVLLWERSAWREEFQPLQMLALIRAVNQSAWAPLIALGWFVAGGLLFLPESALILVTSIVFGFWPGAAFALAGTVANGAIMFGAGRALGRQTVRKLARRRVNRLSRKLARHGLVSVVTLRLYPVASFTVSSLVAGVSGVRVRDYLLGTMIGMAPEVLLVSLFGAALARAAFLPTAPNLALAVLLAALILALAASLRGYPRELRRRMARLRKQSRRKALLRRAQVREAQRMRR